MARVGTHGGNRLGEVARLFLRLGVVGFGGPAAHIAMMRDEVVRRRGWTTDEEFLSLVGAVNLIPGPNSTELAIHLGAKRAGWRGLLAAGVCFITPAVVIVSVLAWVAERHGTSPNAEDLRYGVMPVVVAIVGVAVVGLGRSTAADPERLALLLVAAGAYLFGVHELVILALGGLAALGRWFIGSGRAAALLVPWWLPMPAAAGTGTGASLRRLFLVFLEIGSVLYGSGYVLLAFLQRTLVDELGWVTTEQLLDASAVGQVTPGPVFTTATYLGWLIDGPAGAAVATVGIFLPSFVFVAFLGPLLRWIERHPAARAFLAGVTAASLGLMAGVLLDLGRAALVDGWTVALALAAAAALARFRLNVAWLVAAGVAVGLVRIAAGA